MERMGKTYALKWALGHMVEDGWPLKAKRIQNCGSDVDYMGLL